MIDVDDSLAETGFVCKQASTPLVGGEVTRIDSETQILVAVIWFTLHSFSLFCAVVKSEGTLENNSSRMQPLSGIFVWHWAIYCEIEPMHRIFQSKTVFSRWHLEYNRRNSWEHREQWVGCRKFCAFRNETVLSAFHSMCNWFLIKISMWQCFKSLIIENN